MADHNSKFSGKSDRVMSAQEFAYLGGGEIAYIKSVKAKEMKKLFPQLEDVPEGLDLYALHAADGTPIALTDTRLAAIANAKENDLELVSVH